jgi:sugar-specific transcriptional regulator TrmB
MIEALIRLGLTSSQARVYLVALLGCSKASQISKSSNIGSGDVYRALNSLYSRGLISKKVGMPNTFVPLDFDDAMTRLINQKTAKDKKMVESLKKIRSTVERFEAYKNGVPKETEIAWIPPKLFYLKAHQIVQNAQKEICCILSAENMLLISNEKEGKKNMLLNLSIRFITEKKASSMAFPFFEKITNKQVKYQENPIAVNIFFNDNNDVFLTALPGAKIGFCANIFSDNQCVAQVIREYFELKWKDAAAKP